MNKRKKHKIILATFLIIAMLVCCCGCNKQSTVVHNEEHIEITFSWWGNDERTEYTLEAIKKFEELHPNIKVKCNYSEWSGYETKYNIEMMSHSEADVMQINYSWLQEYSPNGDRYYDLNQLSDCISLDNFTDEQLAFGEVGNSLNAIPIALNTMTIYANESIFSQYGLDIPKTWDDYFKAAEVMNGEVYPLAASAKPIFFLIVSYVEQQSGHQFIDNKGNFGFTKEDFSLMLSLYTDLVNKNVIPQFEYFDKANVSNGTYASVVSWVSDATSYTGDAIDNGYNFVVNTPPTIDGQQSWYIKPATMYAISGETEHPKEAAMLIEYLLNSTEMAEFQGIEKGIPLSKASYNYLVENNKIDGIQYDAHLALIDNIDNYDTISPYFENSDILDAFKNACNDVLFEKATADERAEQLITELRLIPLK